jgi:zinc protease
MKTRNLVTKIVLAGGIVLLLLSLAAPALFPQGKMTPREEKLLNGLKVLMFSDPRADKVTVRIRLHSGSAFDPQGKEGLMKLLAENIFPNAAAREFYKEDLGGDLEITSNYDYIQVKGSANPDQILSLLESLATAVTNPTIDKETTAKLKAAELKQIQDAEADPAFIADQAVAKRLFGTFPYGRPEFGTTDSLQKIDFVDLIRAKQRFLTADNATVTVSGKFDPQVAYRAIRRYFGSWLKADKLVPATFRQPEDPAAATETIASPAADRFEVRYAFRGAARSSTDYAASEVAAPILEARLKAAVPVEFREGVTVRHDAHVLPGMFIVRLAGTKAAAPAKLEANDFLTKALSSPVTDAEFQAAKSAMLNSWNSLDPAEKWLDADTFKLQSAEGESDKLSALKLADVQERMARIQKQPAASVIVTAPAPATGN